MTRRNEGSAGRRQPPVEAVPEALGAPPSPISVLVADAQRLFADALARSLAQLVDLDVIDVHPATGPEAIEAVVLRKPDIALLDYWMPGTHGPTATRTIREWLPRQRVLLLGWFYGPDHIQASMDAGAVGFLPKSLTVVDVAEGIRQAHGGQSPVFAEGLRQLREELGRRCEVQAERVSRLLTLTPREVKIIGMLSRGRPVHELAVELSITPGTLRHYIHSILRKTGARSQMEAVAMARQEGLIRE